MDWRTELVWATLRDDSRLDAKTGLELGGERESGEGKRETTRVGREFSRLCMSFVGSQSYASFGSTLCILFSSCVTAVGHRYLREVDGPNCGGACPPIQPFRPPIFRAGPACRGSPSGVCAQISGAHVPSSMEAMGGDKGYLRVPAKVSACRFQNLSYPTVTKSQRRARERQIHPPLQSSPLPRPARYPPSPTLVSRASFSAVLARAPSRAGSVDSAGCSRSMLGETLPPTGPIYGPG